MHTTANTCAISSLICIIIKVKLVEPIGKGKQHQAVDEEELQDVEEHAAQ